MDVILMMRDGRRYSDRVQHNVLMYHKKLFLCSLCIPSILCIEQLIDMILCELVWVYGE